MVQYKSAKCCVNSYLIAFAFKFNQMPSEIKIVSDFTARVATPFPKPSFSILISFDGNLYPERFPINFPGFSTKLTLICFSTFNLPNFFLFNNFVVLVLL